MPRYYFDRHNDIEVLDSEGVDLPTPKAAIERGVEKARQLATESVRSGYLDLGHYIRVRNESGETLLVVPFGEAVDVVSNGDPV